MNKAQQKKFDLLYQQHVSALRRQGKAENTIDSYSRALRRITEFFDISPDKLTQDHLHTYFDSLIKTHSWSTVKVDRNGLQFFFKYILKKTWQWVEIVKPPQKKVLVGDIDGERMKIHIRLGKGKKDRFVTLPKQALMTLRIMVTFA